MSKLLEQINNKSKIGSIKDLVLPISNTYNFTGKDKVVFINTGDVFEGKFLHNNYSPIKKLPGQAKKIIEHGDILFSEIRPKNRHFALVDFDSKDYVVSTKLIVLRAKEGIDQKYAYIVLTADQNLREFQNIAESRSGTFPQITFESISDYEVNIPDLTTQKKIAEILSAYDEKIENNNKIIKNLEATAQTIFNEWFVNFRFPGYEKIKFVDSETGEIPGGWSVLKLGDIFNIKYGKNLPTSKISTEGKFPVYGAGGVIGFYNERNVDEKVILVTCRGNGSGTIWRTNGEGFVTNNSFLILARDKFHYINFVFIYFLLKNSNITSALSGSAQPQITIDGLSPIETIVPGKMLIESFQKVTTVMFDHIDKLLEENISLRSQRDLLLAKLI